MKKILNTFYKYELIPHINDFFLTLSFFIFIVLRIPSLIEPEWYGDEGIYQVIGKSLNNGRILYKEIWDNKPPLLYLYYQFVNGDLFSIKLLSLLFGAASVIVFFYLAKRLFQNHDISVFISTLLFSVLFGLPVLEGNIANAENFMLFPILLSLFFITKLTAKSRPILPITIGLLLSVAFLTKIVALFDLLAFLVILFVLRFYNKNFNDLKKNLFSTPKYFLILIKQEIIILISFFTPIFLTTIYFIYQKSLGDFLRATFSNNVGYVGWKNELVINFYKINFSIPQGLLFFKIAILLVVLFLIINFRRKFSASTLIIYIWIIFSLFNAFFSGRPYTHYILVALPVLCLLFGLTFIPSKNKFVHFLIFLFLCLVIYKNFDIYKKNIPYYLNYKEFVMGKKSATDFQRFFDNETPRNYKIAEFILKNTQTNDSVFILSNSSTIYYMADKLPPGRYVVAYHIDFYKNAIKETKVALDRKKPKYIISTNDNLMKNFNANYSLIMNMEGVKIYEKVF